MNDHYLIEVTQSQKVYVSIEAESPADAIELALQQNGDISEAYPPEIEKISVKVLRGQDG